MSSVIHHNTNTTVETTFSQHGLFFKKNCAWVSNRDKMKILKISPEEAFEIIYYITPIKLIKQRNNFIVCIYIYIYVLN